MLEAFLWWLTKEALSYVVGRVVRRLGHTEASDHIMAELEYAKALNPDPDPSPAALREPTRYEG